MAGRVGFGPAALQSGLTDDPGVHAKSDPVALCVRDGLFQFLVDSLAPIHALPLIRDLSLGPLRRLAVTDTVFIEKTLDPFHTGFGLRKYREGFELVDSLFERFDPFEECLSVGASAGCSRRRLRSDELEWLHRHRHCLTRRYRDFLTRSPEPRRVYLKDISSRRQL